MISSLHRVLESAPETRQIQNPINPPMNRLLNNWELKVISLVLAVLLWTHVRGEVNPLETAEIEMPLRIAIPQGWQLANAAKIPQRATVTLSGPRFSLRDVRGGTLTNPLLPPSSTRVRIIESPLQPRAGEQKIEMTGETDLSDVEVLGVKPTAISVTLRRDLK